MKSKMIDVTLPVRTFTRTWIRDDTEVSHAFFAELFLSRAMLVLLLVTFLATMQNVCYRCTKYKGVLLAPLVGNSLYSFQVSSECSSLLIKKNRIISIVIIISITVLMLWSITNCCLCVFFY